MLHNSLSKYVFLFNIIHISYIITTFWRYRKKIRGPDPGYSNSFSFCHWNLSSIAAHNFKKMSLPQSYNAIHRFDVICLSETYLDNSYHTNNDQLAFPGYNLIKAHNPNNI